jgi:hypothetical protein
MHKIYTRALLQRKLYIKNQSYFSDNSCHVYEWL